MVAAANVGPAGGFSEVNGATILIVGYGSIGREIGKRAKAMGMRGVGVTKWGKAPILTPTKFYRLVECKRLCRMRTL